MFTKYGYNTMGIVFIVVFVLIAISIFLDNNFIRVPLLLLSVFLTIFTLNFFRDPERTVPNKSNIVVSPADGRVLFVKDVLD
ncbi:MAG: phosphatidylserine decarboxylase family protein, partial [Ignavibacteriales bacterium]